MRKATGGVTILYRICAALCRRGLPAWLVPRESGAWKPEVQGLPEVPFAELRLSPGDIWLVPEGWVNALAPGLQAQADCLVYVQNWAYLFSGLPHGVDWRSLPVRFLAVSRPVAWFVEQSLGRPADILRPSIDISAFAQAGPKPEKLTVAYMPRKNKALAEQIRAVFQARGAFEVTWREIAGLDQAGVAKVLAESHIFLATGFPEGCPLPPLEAMAAGAVPVGFAGLGGWDYMRQARQPGFLPECPLEDVPWGPNGFYAADGDVMGAVLGLEQACRLWRRGGARLGDILAAGRMTAAGYGLDAMDKAVVELWHRPSQPQAGHQHP
jgi:hypothetical protein